MRSFFWTDVPSPNERQRRLARWLALVLVLASILIDVTL